MSNATQIKKENTRSVLHAMIQNESATKPDIVAQTGLTVGTVHAIITDLENKNIIIKNGLSASNGGRKAQLYHLNQEYGFFVGISLRTDKIVAGVFDFCMRMLFDKTVAWPLADYTVPETIDTLAQIFQEILTENHVNKDKLLAIGINVPGPVNHKEGKIFSVQGYSKWHNISLAEEVQKLTGLKVLVDKDVTSGILFLKHLKKASADANMVYLSVEDGIGSGIMLHGEVYRGNHGLAGEIGHMTVKADGEKCNCGNIGCLETISSDYAILKKSKQALGLSQDNDFSLSDAIKYAQNGDERITPIFEEAVKFLALTVRNSFMLYDPDEIFVRCKWITSYRSMFLQLIDDLYDDNTLIDRGKIKVSFVNEEKFALKSAAALAWSYEMESLDSDIFLS